jgi:hypothetical protein
MRLHTVYMAYSECLPTLLGPLAERTRPSQVDKHWTVKVADFGLARTKQARRGATLTATAFCRERRVPHSAETDKCYTPPRLASATISQD